MTLSQKIADAVEQHPVGSASSGLVTAEADGLKLTISLAALGHVGLAFRRIEFSQVDPVDLSPQALRAWGNRLSARLTYLMEPLVVLEVDAEAGKATLRSQNPTSKGDRRSFFEVQLYREGGLHLHRVAFDETTRVRKVVDSQMTLEVLERLTDDLVASLP
jgi:hypothetical protein